ncbi:UNVERIFIED_CONTAM: Retrovirus-related Pol polyprotein from transposon TNT 1-94 [Sesamum indicum]
MEGKFPVERFNGSDFGFWRMQMEAYLYGKDLYEPLAEKSEKTSDEEWKVLDRKAMSAIILSLSRNVAYHVKGAKSTKEVLQTLADMYEKPSAMNKVMLMKKLFRLQMEERKSVADHLNDFNQLTTQLASVDIVFDDEVKALILLSSLPDSWDVVVTSVSTSSGKEKMKFDNIRDMMLNEETRRKQTGGSSGSALHTESRGRPDTRGKYRGRSRSRSRGKNKGKKEMVCWNCEKPGHMKSECRAPKKEKEGRTANAATEEITDALLLSVSSSSDDWVVDSGASFHSCSNKDIMEPYTSGDFGLVYLADNKPLKIVGKGDVRIKSTNGSCWTLHDVRHIPGLKRNLISVGQLDSDGFHTTFGDAKWKISRGAMTLARGLKSGTLYMAGGSSSNIPFAGTVSQANLWHNRLGHMSEKGMNVLKSKGRLPELKSVEVGHCEHCVFGKQKRVSFLTTGRTPRKEKLELVHTDLWGPAPVSSLGGSTYYMTFVDDSTRKVWVYFLKRKSDAFDTFRRWRALVENETGLQVKCLRSDNGGEYNSEGIKNYCADHGIRMQKIIPGTPQQNGVAERMNRTLNERARCMRLKSGLPKMFWADAVNTAAFLINRGPSVPLNNRIPEEVWSGKKVDLSFLRTFGCSAYILNDDRTKLDAKSIKCTFIGYGTDEFGYRFWDDQNRKIIRSRNVIFNEDVMYNDRKVSPDDDKKEREFVDLDISNSGIMRPADTDSVGVQTDETEQTEIEPEPVSEEPITESSTPLALGREPRLRRAPDRYSPSLYYLLLSDCGEPECYAEAVNDVHKSKWELAMNDEMNSLKKNNTWELCQLPKGKKALQNRWVYRVKEESDGKKRYKARLVVKGFQQRYGIDFTDVFTPVVKLTTIRLVLSMVAAENLELQQMDVKTAFLHGDLEEEIYMVQPEGYNGDDQQVCRLKKSLYGLKQAPRQWYRKFDNFMLEIGFSRCNADHCCYMKRFDEFFIILLLYVDDMLIAGSNVKEINRLKDQLSRKFDMKDLGEARQILGMKITRDKGIGKLWLSQSDYIEKVLCRFKMENAKLVGTPLGNQFKLSNSDSPQTDSERAKMRVTPYASAIGSLMYAMICTRPDIAHAVGVVSRFMSNPGVMHWEAVKWILRYLRGTKDRALVFGKGKLTLFGFVDADFAGSDYDKRRSTTGYVFTYGGTAVSWVSKLQKVVTLSTTEAEYVAVTEAAKELIWLQHLLGELGKPQADVILHSDSQSAIHLAKNPAFHSRTKHIEIKYHFIRQLLEKKALQLEKIQGEKNPADMLTKAVAMAKLKLCTASTGLDD